MEGVVEMADDDEILDAVAGLWCVNVGYGRKELAEVAYRQMLDLPYYNTFFKTAAPTTVAAAASSRPMRPAPVHARSVSPVSSATGSTAIGIQKNLWAPAAVGPAGPAGPSGPAGPDAGRRGRPSG